MWSTCKLLFLFGINISGFLCIVLNNYKTKYPTIVHTRYRNPQLSENCTRCIDGHYCRAIFEVYVGVDAQQYKTHTCKHHHPVVADMCTIIAIRVCLTGSREWLVRNNDAITTFLTKAYGRESLVSLKVENPIDYGVVELKMVR